MSEDSVKKFALLPGLNTEYKAKENQNEQNFCSNEEFSVELGVETVEKIIKNWKVGAQWLYCIDYLGETDEEFDTIFTYRVLYSIPTRQKPIPRATASVYFNIKKSKVKPQRYVVEIKYLKPIPITCFDAKAGFSRQF